ncbi:ABC transporter substrate-binding protein [Amycolatopsis sp. WQ 127309]|uniref:ABC transporter substrate-binding protein n=1 Tax=Amycolatopsis sp. WQ 127309 TaxID=2932773 RepID=UPI003530062F
MLPVIAGCGHSSGSSVAAEGKPEKTVVRVSVLPTIDLVPLWLAQQDGYFRDEGITVESVVMPDGQPPLDRMVGGDIDIAFSSYVPFFTAVSAHRADLKVVAGGSYSRPGSSVIATVPDSPVKTIGDLAGKRIAIVGTDTASQLLIRSVMNDHGVAEGRVTWVEMPLAATAAALRDGQVDAAYLPEPFLTQAAVTAGAYRLADTSSGSTQDFPLTGYAATAEWVGKYPKTLAAFQRALQRAVHDSADRGRVEPLLSRDLKVDAGTAALLTLPSFEAKLDSRRLQRVPDLLRTMLVTPTAVDARRLTVPQPSE